MTRRQSGFTLVELLMVVLIIGLLVSIAIPVFNGQRAKAKNSQATSNLTNAFLSGRQEYDSKGTWGESGAEVALATQLSRDEQAFNYRPYKADQLSPSTATTPGVSTGPRDVTVSVEDPDMATFCTKSVTGLYFCLRTDSLGKLPVAFAPTNSFLGSVGLGVPSAYAAGTDTVLRSTGATEAAARAALGNRCKPGYTYPINPNSTAYPSGFGPSCAATASNGAAGAPVGSNEWVSYIPSGSGSGSGGTSTGGTSTGGTSTGGTGSTGPSAPANRYEVEVANDSPTAGCNFDEGTDQQSYGNLQCSNISGGLRNNSTEYAVQQDGAIRTASTTPSGLATTNLANKSILFKGNQQYSYGSSSSIGTENRSWTAEVWVRPTSNNANTPIISGDNQWSIRMTGSGFACDMRQSSPWDIKSTPSGGPAPQASTWYLVACSYDKATGKLTTIVNGTAAGDVTSGVGPSGNPNLKIGYADGMNFGGFLNGRVDQFAFYNKALSAGDVARHYAAAGY